jgi:hypothetical protein
MVGVGRVTAMGGRRDFLRKGRKRNIFFLSFVWVDGLLGFDLDWMDD